MKKVLSVILAVCIAFSFAVICFAADTKSLVVCGDSIAQGYGIQNPDEASYGKILADTLGYSYKNFGHDGDRSIDLLEKLNGNKKGIATAIKGADLILISIGGNDFIKPKTQLPARILPAVVGITDNVDKVQKEFEANFAEIMSKIKSLNSKADIIVQTVYNGHIGLVGWAYNLATSRVNASIAAYLEANPDAYTIVDTAPAFEHHREYIAVDTLHPSALGNVAIAEVILDKLCEMGIADTNELIINAEGVDQIKGFSVTVKKILDFFRKIFFIK